MNPIPACFVDSLAGTQALSTKCPALSHFPHRRLRELPCAESCKKTQRTIKRKGDLFIHIFVWIKAIVFNLLSFSTNTGTVSTSRQPERPAFGRRSQPRQQAPFYDGLLFLCISALLAITRGKFLVQLLNRGYTYSPHNYDASLFNSCHFSFRFFLLARRPSLVNFFSFWKGSDQPASSTERSSSTTRLRQDRKTSLHLWTSQNESPEATGDCSSFFSSQAGIRISHPSFLPTHHKSQPNPAQRSNPKGSNCLVLCCA